MVRFACPNCGKSLKADDQSAGRSGLCTGCGKQISVPHPNAAAPLPPVVKIVLPVAPAPSQHVPNASPPVLVEPKKVPMRLRRLQADADQMTRVFQQSPLIQVLSAMGDPPERYVVEYRVRGLMRGPTKQPIVCERHRIEIQLTREYPRQSPKCKMLTPIFHPNIEPAVICVGDHWTAGERLVDLVIRIGEMLAYQAFNIQSPLDGEAAMWADLNKHRLPIDSRDLRPSNFE